MERRAVAQDLTRIRALMERAGRYSHLTGYSAIGAGLLAVAGAVVCWRRHVNFNHPSCAEELAWIWGVVLALALIQHLGFTIWNARRKGEPAWSPLTQQVIIAMLPSVFVGAVITAYGLQTRQLDLLPPFWMFAYGMSFLGLGLYAGWKLQLVGSLFLLLGAGSLFWWYEYGLRMMLVSFGGLHILLGILIAWKLRASAA